MNAEAKTLADELRTIARCIYIAVEKTVADDIAGKATKAADFLDRLSAPVEGVGLETTAQERDQWRYSVNPFSGEDKERLLRDFNRIVSSLLKADLGRQDAIAAIDAKEAERLFWKERAHEGATAAVQVATELDAIRAERDAFKAALQWFIDDIDGTHTVMLDFDDAVMRARAALSPAQGGK